MKHSLMVLSWCAGALAVALIAARAASSARADVAPSEHDLVRAAVSRRDAIAYQAEAIVPVPPARPADPAVIALGKKLFHEPMLSKDGTLSCASCHDLHRGGADGRATSTGVGGAQGTRNAPTVFDSALSFAQFWDGRARTLEEQVGGPLTNPREMASSWNEALGRLRDSAEYRGEFQRVFRDGVTQRGVETAIAAFERTLVTTGSRFDRYLRGDGDAIDATELRGYQLFQELGCIACHQGAAVGGNSFQRFGVVSSYFDERGGPTDADLGRFAITRNESDRFKFKVPSLRNATRTAPYFHDGSVPTLEEAIRVMAEYQLGVSIDDDDVAAIRAFLGTLEGREDVP